MKVELKITKLLIIVCVLFFSTQVWATDPNVDGRINPNDEYSGENTEEAMGDYGWMNSKYVPDTGMYMCNCWCLLSSNIILKPENSYNFFEWTYNSKEWRATVYFIGEDANDPNYTSELKVLTRPSGTTGSYDTVEFDSTDSNQYDPNNPSSSPWKFAVGKHECNHPYANAGNHFIWELLVPNAFFVDPPPQADAGDNKRVVDSDASGFEVVQLDGSGSDSKDDGSIVSWIWSENGQQIASGAQTSYDFALGTHTVTLTVTDEDGEVGTDTVMIGVVSDDLGIPIADAGADMKGIDYGHDGSVTFPLDGSGSSDNGTIVSWVWSENGQQIDTGSNPDVAFSLSGERTVHIVTLTVTDNDSNTDTDTVRIIVEHASINAHDPTMDCISPPDLTDPNDIDNWDGLGQAPIIDIANYELHPACE